MSCCRLDRGALPKKSKRPRTLPIQVPPTVIEAQYAKALVKYVIGAMRWAYAPLLREVPKLVKARAVARHDAAQPGFAGLAAVVLHARVDAFDPDEPRDESGKWSAEGEAASKVVEAAGKEPHVRNEPEALSRDEYWKAHDAVANRLTDNERQALSTWTSASYSGINEYARGPDADQYATIQRLDTAIAKSTAPRDMTVFRGLNEDRMLGLKPGDTFSDRGFVATSSRQDVGENFAQSAGEKHYGFENAGALVRIIVPKGSHALPVVGQAGDEGEVLLPRGSKFKVLQAVHSGSGTSDHLTITAQLVDDAHRDGVDDPHEMGDDTGRYVWRAEDIVRHDSAERYDSPESRRVQQLIREAARRLRLKLNKREIARLAKKFAEQTSTFQRVQLHRQVHAALGIAAPLAAEYTQSRIADFVRENVALISRIPQEHHGEIETMVHRAVTSGQLSDDLADDLEQRLLMSERHARFIARDQISKLQADLNHARQRDLGVTRFVWRTMRDERVRGTPGGLYPNAQPSHFDLDGEEFAYDNPPMPPGAEGPILPGDDYNCRCYAEPVMDDLVEDIRAGDTPIEDVE